MENNTTTPNTLSLKRVSDPDTYTNFCNKQTQLDVTKYNILEACQIGRYIISFVVYQDATELTDNKVLVWKDLSTEDYRLLDRMDPRFDPMSKLLAVFKPTKDGYNTAINMVSIVQDKTINWKLHMTDDTFNNFIKRYSRDTTK